MSKTIEAMKRAVDALEKHSGNWRLSESEATHQTWVINDLLDAIAAEEAQVLEPVYLVATGEVHEGQETYTRHDVCPPLCDAEKLFTRPAPPADNKFLAGKLELMTAERDKMQLELGDLRSLRARRPAHDKPTQIGGPGDWAIAGIKVKIDGGAPNYHLYRLLGANDLPPGEYELFIRPTQAPAFARPTNCGTGHCSCVECVCEVGDVVARSNLAAKLRTITTNKQDDVFIRKAADMLEADVQPTPVTCQTYGHVVGACAECNTHEESDTPLAWRVSLDKGTTWTIYETDPTKIHGMDAAIITTLVTRHTPTTDWSAA